MLTAIENLKKASSIIMGNNPDSRILSEQAELDTYLPASRQTHQE